MTKRETDTSASEAASDERTRTAVTTDEAEALFDALVAADVLAVGEAGVRTTDAFDDTRAVYHDSYVGVSDAEFHEAVAATFGLPDADAAADLIAEREVTRSEFVCYLAVQSHLDDAESRSATDLAAMAGMVHEAVPDSPVPSTIADVTDDPDAFLAGRDRAVVSVWKRFCDPCEATKADLETILDAVPDGVAVAGIDGEVAVEFCRNHDVASAPGFVVVDGDDRSTVRESDADAVAERLQAVLRDRA
ncbi:thioredoxin domain-containing protein [Halorussus sp. MSC15.2]|uniref:thioredoxin domain-containing protein n=1 Tax=Halorussus sp. MSC15.2 TaxID=2283638 RepID=UPI0013D1B0DD|nr:thioredoxin domain-containing protein [Halorussus sp. MSC15.2]NEU56656.1 thioredoxin [Halorussus sp. MSC15.2]